MAKKNSKPKSEAKSKPNDAAKSERIESALGNAHEIASCIHDLAVLSFDADPSCAGSCAVATHHLSRLVCWHLDVVNVELFGGPGFGTFEAEFKKLDAGWIHRDGDGKDSEGTP